MDEARVRVVDVARAMALVQISGQRDGCQQRDQPGRDPARALAHRRPRHGRMIACGSDGRAGWGAGQELRSSEPVPSGCAGARRHGRSGGRELNPHHRLGRARLYPLSYRRAREPTSQGGSPTMTVCTNHLARVDLVEDRLPVAVAQRGRDAEVLMPEVVELEDQGVGLAAVGAWMLAEELDQVGRSLLDQSSFAPHGDRDVALAISDVVRPFVFRSGRTAVVVALPATLSAPGEVGAWLRSPAAAAGRG